MLKTPARDLWGENKGRRRSAQRLRKKGQEKTASKRSRKREDVNRREGRQGEKKQAPHGSMKKVTQLASYKGGRHRKCGGGIWKISEVEKESEEVRGGGPTEQLNSVPKEPRGLDQTAKTLGGWKGESKRADGPLKTSSDRRKT